MGGNSQGTAPMRCKKVTEHYHARIPESLYEDLRHGKLTKMMFDVMSYLHRRADWRSGVADRVAASTILREMFGNEYHKPSIKVVRRAISLLNGCGYIRSRRIQGSHDNYAVVINNYVIERDRDGVREKWMINLSETKGWKEVRKRRVREDVPDAYPDASPDSDPDASPSTNLSPISNESLTSLPPVSDEVSSGCVNVCSRPETGFGGDFQGDFSPDFPAAGRDGVPAPGSRQASSAPRTGERSEPAPPGGMAVPMPRPLPWRNGSAGRSGPWRTTRTSNTPAASWRRSPSTGPRL